MSAKLPNNHPEDGVIRRKEYQVVDDHGNVRGRFGVKDDGSPRLQLEQPNACIDIELYPNGSASFVLQGAGREDVCMELGIDADGEKIVIIGDKYGSTPCLRLGLSKRGAPVLELLDKTSGRDQGQIN